MKTVLPLFETGKYGVELLLKPAKNVLQLDFNDHLIVKYECVLLRSLDLSPGCKS
jgi:hypothetical protein